MFSMTLVLPRAQRVRRIGAEFRGRLDAGLPADFVGQRKLFCDELDCLAAPVGMRLRPVFKTPYGY